MTGSEETVKKGNEYTGVVGELLFPNKGIIYYEEEGVIHKIIVKGALPGQRIKFMLSKKRSSKYEGRLIEVLEKSDMEERNALCEKFGICGGCTYQTMSYKNQLVLKQNMVKSILEDVIHHEFEFEGIVGSPIEFAYRNKMEYTFGDECKGGALALGLHKKGSFYDIVNTDSCKIVNDDYNKIVSLTLTFFKEKNIPYYHKMTKEGYLRHLLIRRAVKTGDIIVGLVTTTSMEITLNELVEKLLALDLEGNIIGIMHIYNDGLADMVKSDRTEVLYGEEYLYEELLGLRFKISTFSFFQTNSLGAERLYSKVREYVGDTQDKLIFDLYSGTGTIAQILAPIAKKVIGVEIVEEAVEAARENAELNGLDNCEFIAGDVLKIIDEIEDKPDLIVLDPPRDGIHPKALEKIIMYGVDRIVYISCKPTSLARDLEVLQARGYMVEKVCAVDMFPGTVHVETVVLLSQQKPDDYVEVELVLDELDVTSAETKAAYKEIQEYVLKEHGLKVSNLYISQVKRKCGIEVGVNFNLSKSNDAKQPQCPKEKEEAIIEALKAFNMI